MNIKLLQKCQYPVCPTFKQNPRMSKRGVPRINYQVLNSTGEITPLDQNITERLGNMTIHDEPSELRIDALVLIDEVKDIIDENPILEISTSDLDATIYRLEDLYSQVRRKGISLGDTDLSINDTLSSIKDYIKSAKDCKSKTRLQDDKVKLDHLK